MTLAALSDALRDDAEIEHLAASLRAAAASIPGAAIDIALGPDEGAAPGARRLLFYLEDMAIQPMLEPNPPLAEQRVALIARAVQAELAVRRKIIARIDALLADPTLVPVAESAGDEPRPSPRRVCDAAYVQMRRMVDFGESPAVREKHADTFLELSSGMKDQWIKKARKSEVWKTALKDGVGN